VPRVRAAPRCAPRARPSVDRGRGLARVTRRAVAASQLVQIVEQWAGIAYVAPHRAVGPAHPVGVERRCSSTRPATSSTSSFRVAQRDHSLTGQCARRRPRGDGTDTLGAVAAVRGLPTSCRSAARRTRRRGEVFATTAIVCASTSLWRWIGSCSSCIEFSSGGTRSQAPCAKSATIPRRIVGDDELRQLVPDALGAHDLQALVHLLDRTARRGVGLEARVRHESRPRGATFATDRPRTRSRVRAGCAAGAPSVEPTVVRVDELWSRAVRIVEGHRHRFTVKSRGRDRR